MRRRYRRYSRHNDNMDVLAAGIIGLFSLGAALLVNKIETDREKIEIEKKRIGHGTAKQFHAEWEEYND